jgi:transcriptional regulator with XRE-family HTH domain
MTQPLHIFRAGRHTAMSGQNLEFSEAQVRAIAAAYDPALHEAPIVIGHPRADAPAYGWVKSLRAEGAGLFAEPDQVEPAFAEMVSAGRFKKISASFYPPKAAANPAPGSYYLKHVGFLGAQPPAIKGLKPAEFAEDGEAVTLELDFSEAEIAGLASAGFGGLRRVIASLRDWLLASQGQEVADRIVPAHELENIRTTEEFMRSQTARAGGETPVPGFAETDLSRRLNARLDERAEDGAERAALIDRMADAAGIERGTVLQILRGEIATPPEERLRGFARVLGLKADDLIDLVDLADPTEGESDMSGTDKQTPEERLAALEAREAGIAAKEAAFAEARAAARRAEDAALLDALAKDGRIAPGLKPEMAAFMEALDAEAEVSFAEGKATSPRAWFRDLLLKQTKPLIDFSERAGGDTVPQIKTHSDITAAANLLVKQAEAEGRALSFAEAVREIADRMESDNA